MKTKWYRETIEALGMMGSQARIVNKLNAVAAHSDDPRLREMAERLVREILSTSARTIESMPPKNMKNGVPSAAQVIEYCQPLAYPK